MCASRSMHIDALVCAAAIFARTFDPSFKLTPSASKVILPVSSHGTALQEKGRKSISDRKKLCDDRPCRKYNPGLKAHPP